MPRQGRQVPAYLPAYGPSAGSFFYEKIPPMAILRMKKYPLWASFLDFLALFCLYFIIFSWIYQNLRHFYLFFLNFWTFLKLHMLSILLQISRISSKYAVFSAF